MEEKREIFAMLDLMIRPGFCVKEHRIVKCNPAAQALLFAPGTDVCSLLITGREEYSHFQDGCLYLTLGKDGSQWGAAVIRLEGWDIFALDTALESAQLQVLSLAAAELRGALGNVLIAADQLSPAMQAHPDSQARLYRGLHQLLRLVGNMSDAGQSAPARRELTQLVPFLGEILEKAAALLAHSHITLKYTPSISECYALADRELLERAVLNILSNAAKYTPAGGTVTASLTRSGKLLRFTVEDGGPGIDPQLRSTLFSRYLRSPGIEDSRQGLGLGLVLVRSAATSHGGAVLIDSPRGARVTLTLAVQEPPQNTVRSPILRPDYAGGRDHALLELSDCLPPECFCNHPD